MRQIKFRAIFEGKMIHFDLVDVYNNAMTMDNSVIDTIMQFTGLKDKNGKEIYEGDVLRRAKDGEKYHFYIIVEFGNGVFYGVTRPGFNHRLNAENWGSCDYDGGGYDEIIGNVWENPELLNPS